MKLRDIFEDMYRKKRRQNQADFFLLNHITSERRWGEVQNELKKKYPDIQTIEFREALWRLIERDDLLLTDDLTIKPKRTR